MVRAMRDAGRDRLRTALFAGTFVALAIVVGVMIIVVLRLVFSNG